MRSGASLTLIAFQVALLNSVHASAATQADLTLQQVNSQNETKSVTPARFLQSNGDSSGTDAGQDGTFTFEVETTVTRSKDCVRDCLTQPGFHFCRDFSLYNEGQCCAQSDDQCLNQFYDFCSLEFSRYEDKLFTCPFETSRCGPEPLTTVMSTGEVKTVQSRGISSNDVCYYWVGAEPSVATGDFVYVHFTTLTNLDTYVHIKPNIDTEGVICQVEQGDLILLRHPDQIYLAFTARGTDSKFFINSFYSDTLTADAYDNVSRCTDQGARLGDLSAYQTNNSQTVTAGDEVNAQDFNDVGQADTPRIAVLSQSQRQALISVHKPEPLVQEVFVPPTAEEADDTTFKILILVVGILLLVVAVLMLANTWVTRKQLASSIFDREQLRAARVAQRSRQNAQQEESGSESSEEEEQSAEVLATQEARVAAVNQMLSANQAARPQHDQGQVIQAGHFNLADPNRPQQVPEQPERRSRESGNDRPRRRRPRNENNDGNGANENRNQAGSRNRNRRRIVGTESSQPNQTYSSNGPMLQPMNAQNDSLDAIDLGEVDRVNERAAQGAAPARNGSVAIQSLVQNNADRRNNQASREDRVQIFPASGRESNNDP